MDLSQFLVTLAVTILSTCSHPLTEKPGGFHQSTNTLLAKISRRLMTVPNINALTDPEEMLLVDENTVIHLTPRSTKINKAAMKAMRSKWKYNMTSPKYRRTINPHDIVINSTMTSKEHEDLQFLRWREVFLLNPSELTYYMDLRRKFYYHTKRKCPSCRQIVLDTYEQYNFHSFEYDEKGYVRCVTPPVTIRYNYPCYMCPAQIETFDEYARHMLNHSIQFAKHETWKYPYTAPPTVARRKTSIIEIDDETLYFNVWPAQDESSDKPPWKRGGGW